MKKFVCALLALTLVFSAIALVACVDKPAAQEVTELILPTMDKNQMAVIVKNGDKDYTNIVVTLGAGGVQAKNVQDVLEYLNAQEMLDVVLTDGQYGKFIVSIGKAVPQGDNEFVSILTSVESDKGNWAGVIKYKVGSVELVSAQVGISEMTVEAGAVIYFEIATY